MNRKPLAIEYPELLDEWDKYIRALRDLKDQNVDVDLIASGGFRQSGVAITSLFFNKFADSNISIRVPDDPPITLKTLSFQGFFLFLIKSAVSLIFNPVLSNQDNLKDPLVFKGVLLLFCSYFFCVPPKFLRWMLPQDDLFFL